MEVGAVRDDQLRSTIEIPAPIEAVWELLLQPASWLGASRTGWSVHAASWDLWGGPLAHRFALPAGGAIEATSTTSLARCPDRLRWTFVGGLTGEVDFELDDLDELTFVHTAWRVRVAGPLGPGRIGVGQRARVRWHDRLVACLAASLGDHLDCREVAVRSGGDRRGRARLTLDRLDLGAVPGAGRGPAPV
jgi:uncharacterized protein YndB with AHSA1/START domain